jgi:hypothetical protein
MVYHEHGISMARMAGHTIGGMFATPGFGGLGAW